MDDTLIEIEHDIHSAASSRSSSILNINAYLDDTEDEKEDEEHNYEDNDNNRHHSISSCSNQTDIEEIKNIARASTPPPPNHGTNDPFRRVKHTLLEKEESEPLVETRSRGPSSSIGRPVTIKELLLVVLPLYIVLFLSNRSPTSEIEKIVVKEAQKNGHIEETTAVVDTSKETTAVVEPTSSSEQPKKLEEYGPPPIQIPPSIANNLASMHAPVSKTETPVFWHIPRVAGSTVKAISQSCIGLVTASEIGGAFSGHADDQELKVLELENPRGKFINIDVTNPQGLTKAKSLGLAQSNLAQLIVTSFFLQSSDIFDPDHPGRMFTLMRHPIERAASVYQAITANKVIENMSIEEYAKSPKVNENWMVRSLTGKMIGKLEDADLATAKEILKEKFLVGLLSHVEESFRRFGMFFGWDLSGEETQSCVGRFLTTDKRGKSEQELVVAEGTDAWLFLENVNRYDIKLYNFAVSLFHEQGPMFQGQRS